MLSLLAKLGDLKTTFDSSYEELVNHAKSIDKTLETRRLNLEKHEEGIATKMCNLQTLYTKYNKMDEHLDIYAKTHKGNVLSLNVGGSVINTTHDTITSIPGSMLSAMFSGRHDLMKGKARPQFDFSLDEKQNVFLDRDPKIFKHVLNYLRDGVLNLDTIKPQMREQILDEFDYFCIPVPSKKKTRCVFPTNMRLVNGYLHKSHESCSFIPISAEVNKDGIFLKQNYTYFVSTGELFSPTVSSGHEFKNLNFVFKFFTKFKHDTGDYALFSLCNDKAQVTNYRFLWIDPKKGTVLKTQLITSEDHIHFGSPNVLYSINNKNTTLYDLQTGKTNVLNGIGPIRFLLGCEYILVDRSFRHYNTPLKLVCNLPPQMVPAHVITLCYPILVSKMEFCTRFQNVITSEEITLPKHNDLRFTTNYILLQYNANSFKKFYVIEKERMSVCGYFRFEEARDELMFDIRDDHIIFLSKDNFILEIVSLKDYFKMHKF